MKAQLTFFFSFLIFVGVLPAQQWGGGRPGGGGFSREMLNSGHFYGKVVDENGKAVAYAAVQLFGMKFDTVQRRPVEQLIAGQITEENGDFSLEKVPVRGEFTLRISILGYATTEQKVTFGLPGFGSGGGGRPGAGWQRGGQPGGGRPGAGEGREQAAQTKEGEKAKEEQAKEKGKGKDQKSSVQRGNPGGGQPGGGNWRSRMAGMSFDKDLGNITIQPDAETLDEIVVHGEATNVKLALDKKIFRVDKDASAEGGTAEDALKNIPSLTVDIDGNLTVRNSSPQLFVDGRPTTLSLDQIGANEIETVEVITNPSAKYDASGGQGGIVNIVLKKNRKPGYNGSVRAGVDTRNGYNGGLNLNMKEGKVNAFLNAGLFRRRSISEGETDRQNLFGNPRTNVLQVNDSEFKGLFGSLRGGVDLFLDNRNTLTIAGNYRRGEMEPDQSIRTFTDSLFTDRTSASEFVRVSETFRNFENVGASLLFKHLFPKKGKEITADLNINRFDMDSGGDFNTLFVNSGFTSLEKQEGASSSTFITAQADYEDKVGENGKLEMGVRAAIRDYNSSNGNFSFDTETNQFVRIPNFADEYEFEDAVYAAYATFSQEFSGWSYQVGLRAESSSYTGYLPESDATFENDYPLSLFPSVFLTKKINEKDDLQLSYSRRVNRPSFFNLIPFTDFSDSLNLRRGNPNLLPEFTNSFEATYQNIFDKGDNLLITVYYKTASDLITTFQDAEFNELLGQEVVVSTYQNSNSSIAYGAEFTLRNSFSKSITLTSNLNLYNSRVDASNVESDLVNDQFTWFLKENLSIQLPKSFSLQINGEYRSRAAFSPSNGGRRYGGWRRSTNTAQGYTKENWFVDFSVRKSILKRMGTITASIRDVFRSRKTGSFSESDFFIQDSWRLRNPQVVSLNFSYRFGKMDTSLFKRKNNKVSSEGMELMN